MKKSILICIILLSCISSVHAITITFDELMDDEVVNTQFSVYGIVFDNEYAQNSPIPSPFTGMWLSGDPTGNYDGKVNTPISGFFVNPSNPSDRATTIFLSANIAYPDDGTITTLEVFDINNNFLTSVSLGNQARYIEVYASGIASFVFSWEHPHPKYDDVIGIDNLTFDHINPIPIPNSIVFLWIGLLGLTALRRRWLQVRINGI